MESMEHDFMGRGYLLPTGCKDLIDALEFKEPQPSDIARVLELSKLKLSPQLIKRIKLRLDACNKAWQMLESKQPLPKQPVHLSPFIGEIVIPEKTSASQLAALLGQKTSQIVADMMELGFVATPNEPLSFEIISRVARKHGFFAIKAAY